jgi:hypothetical protein
MSEEKSWFVKGQEGFDKKKQIDQVTQTRKEKGVPRFWLKGNGSKAKIVFLDGTNPIFIYEHNEQIGGRFGNYYTCSQEIRPCPICTDKEQGGSHGNAVYTAYFTVIDTREYLDKRTNRTVRNTKVLYPAKGSTIKKIQDMIKRHGDLRGKMFEVTRFTVDDPNCGRDFDFIKDADLSKLNDSTPYEYEKVLALPSEEELSVLGVNRGDSVPGPAPVGSAEDLSNGDDLF